MKNNLNKQQRERKIVARARREFADELVNLIDMSFDGCDLQTKGRRLEMFFSIFAENDVMRESLISMRDNYRLMEMIHRDNVEMERKMAEKKRAMAMFNIQNFNNAGGTFNNYERQP